MKVWYKVFFRKGGIDIYDSYASMECKLFRESKEEALEFMNKKQKEGFIAWLDYDKIYS